ncbi:MAG: HAD-IIA family hydrolase [Magnetococcales bacterium]|nr:HAD-IIA family hydrolase [Magnetococcales bacterium]
MIKLIAFDLDGTLYLGDEIIHGAKDTIEYLKDKYSLVYFTNNSSKTKLEVTEKLNRLGIECDSDHVYTSSSSAAAYLIENKIDNIYVIGAKGLSMALEQAGLRVVDGAGAENLLVGMDFDISYEKIAHGLAILKNGGKFVACNEDGSFPVEGEQDMPGCGAMVGAIKGSIGRGPDYIVGKPNTYIIASIAKKHNLKSDELLIVGDSFESDIQMAKNFCCKSILLSARSEVSPDPDFDVVADHGALLQYFQQLGNH